MTPHFLPKFQIATFVLSAAISALSYAGSVSEKGAHEGLLLDSRITYSDSAGQTVEEKVILNGEHWTLVGHSPQGYQLYARTEKVVANAPLEGSAPVAGSAAVAGHTDNETIHVLYRETNEAGAELGASTTTASIGTPATLDLKDAHIETRVSKVRYQLE